MNDARTLLLLWPMFLAVWFTFCSWLGIFVSDVWDRTITCPRKSKREEEERANQRRIQDEQQRIEAEQKRIEAEQMRIQWRSEVQKENEQREERRRQHLQQWREFLDGEALVVPATVWPDELTSRANAWVYLGIEALKDCKARGDAWTEKNLFKNLGFEPNCWNESLLVETVSAALYALTTVRCLLQEETRINQLRLQAA